MRILLDECVPRRLKRELSEFTAATVQDEGWTSRRNGDLLRAMQAARFAVFVTMDRNLVYQQNVATLGLAVVVLHAPLRLERLLGVEAQVWLSLQLAWDLYHATHSKAAEEIRRIKPLQRAG